MKRPSVNIQTSQLLTAVGSIVRNLNTELPKTLAKVTAVEEEGYSVEVEFIDHTLGAERISGVPVLKNKYINYPILEGDLVILLTLSHALDSYTHTGSYTNVIETDAYFALPYVMFEKFKHLNEFSLISPKENVKVRLNDDEGIIIENNSDFVLNSRTFNVTTQSEVKVEGSTIEMKTPSMTLGEAFEKVIDSFADVAVLNTPNGGAVTEWPGIVAKLQSLKPLIKAVFK